MFRVFQTKYLSLYKLYFFCPCVNNRDHIVFGPSVCPSVRPFIRLFVRKKTLHLSYLLSIPCDKTFLLVPSSRPSVNVKYQGHSFRKKKKKKNGSCRGIGVSQTQLVSDLKLVCIGVLEHFQQPRSYHGGQ